MISGQKLRLLRIRKGLTQKELAKELNLSDSTISYYEKEERIPNIEVLIQIADYFEVDVNYLLGIDSRGYSDDKMLKMSNEEIEFILELRRIPGYSNMIINPKNYAKLIDLKTSSYNVKI